jgi:hypothetical protein
MEFMAADDRPINERATEEANIQGLIKRHLARYPLMRLTDLYKLLFQAACGPGHAGVDEARALAQLELEAASLQHQSEEPIIDPISPDGSLARLHLVPYLAAGGTLSDLASAFVLSIHAFAGSQDQLHRYWETAHRLASTASLPFSERDLQRYWATAEQLDFPALHHSIPYRKRYHPAYRLVLVNFFKGAHAARGPDRTE